MTEIATGCLRRVNNKIKRSLVTFITMRETGTEMATGCLRMVKN